MYRLNGDQEPLRSLIAAFERSITCSAKFEKLGHELPQTVSNLTLCFMKRKHELEKDYDNKHSKKEKATLPESGWPGLFHNSIFERGFQNVKPFEITSYCLVYPLSESLIRVKQKLLLTKGPGAGVQSIIY